MSGIFDIDGVNWDNISLPSAGGVGISLPPGFWPVTITDVKMQSASEGKPDYIAVSMRVRPEGCVKKMISSQCPGSSLR